MKKIKFFVAILAVAIIAMGAAYAGWAEDLEIDGTVETGEVDLEWSSSRIANSPDEVEASADHTAETVTVTASNLYPVEDLNAPRSERVQLSATFRNEGTLPVKISDASFELTSDGEGHEELFNALRSVIRIDAYFDVDDSSTFQNDWRVGSYSTYKDFNELDEFLKDELVGKVVHPNGWVSFGGEEEGEEEGNSFHFWLPAERVEDNEFQNVEELEFELEIEGVQFNR